MEIITQAFEFIMHIDVYLRQITSAYGAWTYVILFIIIFCETGLVVTPFLPGDSLLFAAGAVAALGGLEPLVLFVVLSAAAILGDASNYWIGKFFGPKVMHKEDSRVFRPEYLRKTHAFYERYGGKTIVLARFVPIVRTFAPFLAGVGTMRYRHFFVYNVVGGVAWVALFVGAGYVFGNVPAVQHNFTLVILAIVAISIAPALAEWARAKYLNKAQGENA